MNKNEQQGGIAAVATAVPCAGVCLYFNVYTALKRMSQILVKTVQNLEGNSNNGH